MICAVGTLHICTMDVTGVSYAQPYTFLHMYMFLCVYTHTYIYEIYILSYIYERKFCPFILSHQLPKTFSRQGRVNQFKRTEEEFYILIKKELAPFLMVVRTSLSSRIFLNSLFLHHLPHIFTAPYLHIPLLCHRGSSLVIPLLPF